MFQGDIGIFRGFVYKNGCKVPLIEINGNISEIPIPIVENVKPGDRIIVYNSYNFEYEFKPLEFKFKLLNATSIIKEKLSKLLWKFNSSVVYCGSVK